MFTRPTDLSDEAVATTFRDCWGIDVERIEYAKVGFGSHHWRVVTKTDRWFLTIDDLSFGLRDHHDTRLAVRRRLEAALTTAVSLRSEGRDFVIAPVPSNSGRLVESLDGRYVLAVYPHVDGTTGPFGPFENQTERFQLVDRLVAIHAAETGADVRADDLSIPSRERLTDALADTSQPWSTGPFGDQTRTLLEHHRGPLQRTLAAFDQLVSAVRADRDLSVITHGEPHRGNVIFTGDGPVLIDWDTTLLAPPERDLWRLVDEDPEVRGHYERASGRMLENRTLRTFALWWDLCEVALFVDGFRRPHQDTADTEMAWRGLQEHLDPTRWLDLI